MVDAVAHDLVELRQGARRDRRMFAQAQHALDRQGALAFQRAEALHEMAGLGIEDVGQEPGIAVAGDAQRLQRLLVLGRQLDGLVAAQDAAVFIQLIGDGADLGQGALGLGGLLGLPQAFQLGLADRADIVGQALGGARHQGRMVDIGQHLQLRREIVAGFQPRHGGVVPHHLAVLDAQGLGRGIAQVAQAIGQQRRDGAVRRLA